MSPKQKRCQPLLSFRRGTGNRPPLPPTPAAACASSANRKSEKSARTLRAHSTGIVSFVSGRSDAVDPSSTVLSFIISQKDVAELPALFTHPSHEGFYCLWILLRGGRPGVVGDVAQVQCCSWAGVVELGHCAILCLVIYGRGDGVLRECCRCCVLFLQPLLARFAQTAVLHCAALVYDEQGVDELCVLALPAAGSAAARKSRR